MSVSFWAMALAISYREQWRALGLAGHARLYASFSVQQDAQEGCALRLYLMVGEVIFWIPSQADVGTKYKRLLTSYSIINGHRSGCTASAWGSVWPALPVWSNFPSSLCHPKRLFTVTAFAVHPLERKGHAWRSWYKAGGFSATLMPSPHHCHKLTLWAVSWCEAAIRNISPWALPVPLFSKWQVVLAFCQNSAHKSALHSVGVTMLEGPATTLSWHHRQGWQVSKEDLSWDWMTVPTVSWGHLWREIFKWYICSVHTEVLGVGSGILGICSSGRGLGCS